IYYSVFCNAFLAVSVVLLASPFSLAQIRNASSQAAAQSQVGQGKQVQLEGELEIIHQDFKDGHGTFLYSLKQADGTRVSLHFSKQPPTHLLTGDHVRANGQLSGGTLVLYSGSPSLTKTTGVTTTTSSIPVPYTF